MFPVVLPFIRLALRILFFLFGGYHARGAERIPKSGGVILASNHISDIDPTAIGLATPRPLWFMGKAELFDIPILGWILHRVQTFPVRRGQPDRAALRRVDRLLLRGEAVVIFPEGRDSLDGRLQALQPGAAMIALKNQVPLLPIALRGTSTVMPPGLFVPRWFVSRTFVHVGQPIFPSEVPENLNARQQREWLTERLHQALRNLLSGVDAP